MAERTHHVRLGTLLIGVNTGLVLLAVVVLAIAAGRLLGRLAEEQALARVGLAGEAALQAVERSAGDVRTSARLLAERPTVGRLLGQGDTAGLAAFLDRFREASHLSACAVLVGGRPVATGGGGVPWPELLRAGPAEGGAGEAALARAPDGGLVFAAAAPSTVVPNATAVAALR